MEGAVGRDNSATIDLTPPAYSGWGDVIGKTSVFTIHVMMLMNLMSWMMGFRNEDLAVRVCLWIMVLLTIVNVTGHRGRNARNASLSVAVWIIGIFLAERSVGSDHISTSGLLCLVAVPWLLVPVMPLLVRLAVENTLAILVIVNESRRRSRAFAMLAMMQDDADRRP